MKKGEETAILRAWLFETIEHSGDQESLPDQFTRKLYTLEGKGGIYYRVHSASDLPGAVQAFYGRSKIMLVPFAQINAELGEAGFLRAPTVHETGKVLGIQHTSNEVILAVNRVNTNRLHAKGEFEPVEQDKQILPMPRESDTFTSYVSRNFLGSDDRQAIISEIDKLSAEKKIEPTVLQIALDRLRESHKLTLPFTHGHDESYDRYVERCALNEHHRRLIEAEISDVLKEQRIQNAHTGEMQPLSPTVITPEQIDKALDQAKKKPHLTEPVEDPTEKPSASKPDQQDLGDGKTEENGSAGRTEAQTAKQSKSTKSKTGASK